LGKRHYKEIEILFCKAIDCKRGTNNSKITLEARRVETVEE